jgi:long-chain fatty acid transport protein
MKTLSKNLLATAITTLFIAPAAFATNGTNMTGVSAVSSALGGTGTAAYFGAANVIINPAMIGKGDGTIIGFGGTLFKPSVSNDGSTGGTKHSSSADTFMIPSVAISSRINNNWSFGIGMFGTSGMGVDYSNYSNTNPATAGLVKAQSTLQIMRIVPTIAYNSGNFGVGFSPIIQYGALDVNYDTFNPTNGNPMTFGKGMASDLGMGYTLGGYFDVSKQFTLGAAYTSAINMKYKNQLNGQTGAASNFGLTNITDQLEQPAEIKVGAAYTMGNIMMTGDLKQIRWGEAKGYKDFGWKDQNVLALGVRYTQPSYWLGIGYNKADNPIPNLAIGMTAQGQANANINMFNNVFFPATTEQHFSFGGGYVLTKNVGIDAAVVYAPEVNSTVDVLTPGGAAKNTTSHSQIGYTVSVRYKF